MKSSISAVATLTRDTKMMVWGLREQLVREMFNFYEGDDSNEEPELRMANLFMILAAVKVCKDIGFVHFEIERVWMFRYMNFRCTLSRRRKTCTC